ncbi:MAG: prepilin-type N-terminal cleavage/methylation domain-containing protein [Candidatus Buchananbacteria bacterium]|nr:prepilin-type N-terminal cleavage/methylation domain-containing protein [Candidatus Buchananbacteria bacterium]
MVINSKKIKLNNSGFTLLELLLSIALLAIIAGIGIPIYHSLQTKNNLDVAVVTIVQDLRRAQIAARASDGDTSWGVYIQSDSITFYQGSSYGSRNTSYDEIADLPTNITPSGLSDIVFSKFTGLPQLTGTITLTLDVSNVKNIVINSKGMISY